MDVKHPETGAVRVWITVETVQKRGKMKVQSVSTESLDTRLRVQNSVWGTEVTRGPKKQSGESEDFLDPGQASCSVEHDHVVLIQRWRRCEEVRG